MPITILHGDCLEVLPTLPDNSIDAICCDPPYHLGPAHPKWLPSDPKKFGRAGFMGKEWDGGDIAFRPDVWRECLRVLKPGGHMVVFGGSRTHHRVWAAIEDAGFEIRDTIMWLYGSGFPKSLAVDKAIDRHLGAEREVIGKRKSGIACGDTTFGDDNWKGKAEGYEYEVTSPATPEAQAYHGFGTALKPAHEPICLARKPLIGTVAENVLAHGTGGLNIDGCRVGTETRINPPGHNTPHETLGSAYYTFRPNIAPSQVTGRWPANVCHDGSEEVIERFPETAPAKAANRGLMNCTRHGGLGDLGANTRAGTDTVRGHDDDGGSASRYFYNTKCDDDNLVYGHGLGWTSPETTYHDSGSASRFYASLRDEINNGCNVNTAAGTSSLLNELDASAQNLAAIAVHLEGTASSDSIRHFMSDMANASRRNAVSDTDLIRSIEQRCLQELSHISMETSNGSHARIVALNAQTSIITITASLLSIAGSADAAMFESIATSLEHGVRVCESGRRVKYCAKASRKERQGSKHPTIKPLKLMEYLIKLITPPGGTVLDPFAGSGTTGEAACSLGFDAILIEREAEYIEDCKRRLAMFI